MQTRMVKRKFTDAERYAVFTAHGEQCYLCGEPVDLCAMQVDHVIPESLLGDRALLTEVLKNFGLPENFDLQSFSNWLPACGPCNNEKRSHVFRPTPMMQKHLDDLGKQAVVAEQLARRVVSNRQASSALNTLRRMYEGGQVDDKFRVAIDDFVAFHAVQRPPETADQLMRLTPLIEVMRVDGGVQIVKGPYGVGRGSSSPNIHNRSRCPICGFDAWNGARCVVCGEMDED